MTKNNKFMSFLLSLAMLLGVLMPSMTQAALAASSNPYPYWQSFYFNGVKYQTITCTYYTWDRVYQDLSIALPAWGNGGSWPGYAQEAGYQIGQEARIGSIAYWLPTVENPWGHVAYVTAVWNGHVTYDEGGSADRRANAIGIYEGHTLPDGYTKEPDGYIYLIPQILPPNAGTVAGNPSASCDHSYLNCVEGVHPHRTYQYCIDCGDTRYTNTGSYSSSCESCNPAQQWTSWSAWSTEAPTEAANRQVEKREVVEGYNLVTYVTQEAAYPYYRNFRNYSISNLTAYGLRTSYGEHAWRRYATKAELDAAATCQPGTYICDGVHVSGWYRGEGTAYSFPDGYYWYVDSPVTRTEYRFRDQVS